MLYDVIPAAPEMLRERSQIYELFGDPPETINSLYIAMVHFLALLWRNALNLILIAFAFSSLG
jgi:hypothetical protein